MPRVDLYCIIHKTLRNMLFDTARCIAEANFEDSASKAHALEKLDTTLGFLEEHNGHEDDFVDPVIAAVDSGLSERIHAEHNELHEHMVTLRQLGGELGGADGPTAVGLGARLHLTFSVFMAGYLSHMATEEVEANQVLWEHKSDPELVEVRTALQGSIPPERFGQWFTHMVPAMNWQERVGVLSGMKMHAPPHVFDAMSGVARQAIGDDAWAALADALPA